MGFGFHSVEQTHGYIIELGREHTGGVENLGTEIGKLGGLFIMKLTHGRCSLDKSGVVVVHAVDVGPNFNFLGFNSCSDE